MHGVEKHRKSANFCDPALGYKVTENDCVLITFAGTFTILGLGCGLFNAILRMGPDYGSAVLNYESLPHILAKWGSRIN